MSLRLRLTLFTTLFLAVVLILVATAVYLFTERSLVESIAERASQTMTEVLSSEEDVLVTIRSLSNDTVGEIALFTSSPNNWQALKNSPLVIRSSGYMFYSDSLISLIGDQELQTLFEEGHITSRLKAPERGAFVAQVRMINIQRAVSLDRGLLLIGYPFPTDRLTQLRFDLIRTVIAAFLVFGIGLWLLSQRVLLPVKRVTQASARVTAEDLSRRVPVPKTKDEVGVLALTINHMLDRLQESLETQRRFTADASHELRTPVTAIVGHANYLLRRTKPNAEQVDSLVVIRREAERMAKLVNDLLELARADAGFIVEKHPMNLVDVIEAVHMEIAPVAGNAEIEVSTPQPLVEVSGDESRLKQVVLNLVQNALNAGATRINISLSKEKQQVRLEILDNGPGIPSEAIPHLFDRFYRVDGARSTRGNGSGLGLAIVHWIVDQHGGSVTAESQMGEGTVFTIMLPALEKEHKTLAGVH